MSSVRRVKCMHKRAHKGQRTREACEKKTTSPAHDMKNDVPGVPRIIAEAVLITFIKLYETSDAGRI